MQSLCEDIIGQILELSEKRIRQQEEIAEYMVFIKILNNRGPK